VLCAVCCVLCAVCCVLCAVCCVLCAVCCVLCDVCCVLCAVSASALHAMERDNISLVKEYLKSLTEADWLEFIRITNIFPSRKKKRGLSETRNVITYSIIKWGLSETNNRKETRDHEF
jgi:hypothetical protein